MKIIQDSSYCFIIGWRKGIALIGLNLWTFSGSSGSGRRLKCGIKSSWRKKYKHTQNFWNKDCSSWILTLDPLFSRFVRKYFNLKILEFSPTPTKSHTEEIPPMNLTNFLKYRRETGTRSRKPSNTALQIAEKLSKMASKTALIFWDNITKTITQQKGPVLIPLLKNFRKVMAPAQKKQPTKNCNFQTTWTTKWEADFEINAWSSWDLAILLIFWQCILLRMYMSAVLMNSNNFSLKKCKKLTCFYWRRMSKISGQLSTHYFLLL